LIDLPSWTKEKDNGKLNCRKMPFGIPKAKYEKQAQLPSLFLWIIALKTVCNFLNLQCRPFENDAKPQAVQYCIIEED